MTEYEFVTNWLIEAPHEKVWEAIAKPEDWPLWWQAVEVVELLHKGEQNGLGSVRRFVWKGRLPYKLIFQMEVTRVERPFVMEGRARGELDGVGIWTLEERAQNTAVRYDWRVRTTRSWMNLLAPIARPMFRWNHDFVMRQGGEGLAKYLNTRLIEM